VTEITQKQKELAQKAEKIPNKRIYRLFPIICRKEWIMQAMWNVLHNEGAKTAGIDGIIKADYYDAETRSLRPRAIKRIEKICQELIAGEYFPKPAIRTYIPKPNGGQRPLGIPTLDDRTVQEAIRMVIEPIYESIFLDCSYGFRPNRRTMDAIARCYQNINPSKKYYWVIEGDIKGCFDNIDHKILLKLLKKRIADKRLVGTIHKFLKAGYQEDGRIYKPDKGTPQGGVISPLLANIYLHEMDVWWKEHYADQRTRDARRRKNSGNFILSRYADDFIMLGNGSKEIVTEMKKKLARFLREELRLELSQGKTLVTHVMDGFNFLGFHVRKYKETRGVIIKPTKDSIQKVKDEINRMLSRKKHEYAVVDVIRALRPVVRGWANYYRFVNSFETFMELDWYLAQKFLKWYRGKYQMNEREGTREGLKWIKGTEPLHLPRFEDVKVSRYKWEKKSNPYIEMKVKRMSECSIQRAEWFGQSARDADLRFECIKRDNGVCQICKRPKVNLIAHHIIPISDGGEDDLKNLITICEDCQSKHYKELHQEIKSLQEIMQLGGSRVH